MRKYQRFIGPPKKRRLRALGTGFAVSLMALAGLDQNIGGKVAWLDNPGGPFVLWSSPDSNERNPSWIDEAPIAALITVYKVAGDTTFVDPGNWNDSNNTIQAIGRGGNGSIGSGTTRGGPGGGGAAFAMRTNVALSANGDFPVTLAVGNTGSAITTSFNTAHSGRDVVADFGRNSSTTTAGAGGTIANSIPNSALSGGNGATAGASGGTRPGAGIVPGSGGGGAGGPAGAGSTGGSASSTQGGAGGNANNSTTAGPAGATGNNNGTTGNHGTEFDGTHGCGTGGSGGGTTSGNLGGPGGTYGGGAAGNSGNSGAAQAGGAGLIIITYVALPQTGSATLASTGTVALNNVTIRDAGPETLAGVATLSVDAQKAPQAASATLAGVGAVSCDATATTHWTGEATLAGTGAVAADSNPPCQFAGATLAGGGSLSCNAGIFYQTGFEAGDSTFNTLGSGSSIQTTNVNRGVNSLKQAAGESRFRTGLAAKQSTLRFSLFLPAWPGGFTNLIVENSTNRLTLQVQATGKLRVADNAATLGLTAVGGSQVLAPGQYNEIKLAYDLAAGGVVQVWVNGTLDINTTHTNDVSATPTDRYRLVARASPDEWYIDDYAGNTETLVPPASVQQQWWYATATLIGVSTLSVDANVVSSVQQASATLVASGSLSGSAVESEAAQATLAGIATSAFAATGGTFPQQIGNANNITSGSGFALSRNVISGSTIIVFAGDPTDNGSINGCSDTQNGAYARAILQVSANTPPVAIFFKVNAKALTAGVDQISVSTEGAGYYATAIAMAGIAGSIQTAGDSVFNADNDTVTLAGLPSLGAFCVAAIQFDEDPGAFVETLFADNTDPATPFFHSGTDDAHGQTSVAFAPTWAIKRDFSIAMAAFLYGQAATGTLSGAGSLTCAAAIIDHQARGTEAGIGVVALDATHTPSGAKTLSGVATLAITPRAILLAATSLAGTGQASLDGLHTPSAGATLSGASTLSLGPVTIRVAQAATLTGESALSLGPVTIRAAKASIGPLAGIGTITCDAVQKGIQIGSATLAGSASLSAVAIVRAAIAPTLSGVGQLSLDASHQPQASASLAGSASLVASAFEIESDSASLSAEAAVSVIAFVLEPGASQLDGEGDLAAETTMVRSVGVTLAGRAVLTGDMIIVSPNLFLAGEAHCTAQAFAAEITYGVTMSAGDRAIYVATAKDAA